MPVMTTPRAPRLDESAGVGGRAGAYVMHPMVWLAIAVLVVNDHVLKGRLGGLGGWGSWITGKLSDVAGLVFFPLVLAGAIDLGAHVAGRPLTERSRGSVVATVAAVVAAGFASIQLSSAAAYLYTHAVAALQWPVVAILSLARGHGMPALVPVAHTADPTDLVALPAVLVALWIARPRARERAALTGPATEG